jgi:hypothetical protein
VGRRARWRCLAQHEHDLIARGRELLASELGVALVGALRREALVARATVADRHEPPIEPDDLAQRELPFTPPGDVRLIAEGAHHQDAGALRWIGKLARKDRHGHLEQRCHRVLAEQVLVARVVWVRRDADASRKQLGPRGGNDKRAVAALHAELDVMVRARALPIFDLRLCDGGLEVDVPHGRRPGLVGHALLEQIEKRALRDPATVIVDGGVRLPPVDAQPEPTKQPLERQLVLVGQRLTELDEVLARHQARTFLAQGVGRLGQGQPGLVGDVRFAADVKEVLHAPLGRQPVIVPTHRIEDVLAAHAPETHDHVGLRVREHVAHVQRARHGGRRRIDDEGLLARARLVVVVDARLLPRLVPALLRRGGFEVLG